MKIRSCLWDYGWAVAATVSAIGGVGLVAQTFKSGDNIDLLNCIHRACCEKFILPPTPDCVRALAGYAVTNVTAFCCDGGYQSVSAYEGRMILGCTLGGAVALTIGSTIGIYGGFWTKAGTRTVQACRNLCIREGYEQLDDKATEHTQNM